MKPSFTVQSFVQRGKEDESNQINYRDLKSLTANCFKGLRWDPTYRIHIIYVFPPLHALKTLSVIRQT